MQADSNRETIQRSRRKTSDKKKPWDKLAVKYTLAWVSLVVVLAFMWIMARPFLPEKAATLQATGLKNTLSESSKEAISEKEVVAGVTTTTVIGQAESTGSPLKLKAKILAKGLNVRKKPTTNSPVISSIAKGEIVTVYEVKQGWLKVKAPDKTIGYIKGSKNLVTLIE